MDIMLKAFVIQEKILACVMESTCYTTATRLPPDHHHKSEVLIFPTVYPHLSGFLPSPLSFFHITENLSHHRKSLLLQETLSTSLQVTIHLASTYSCRDCHHLAPSIRKHIRILADPHHITPSSLVVVFTLPTLRLFCRRLDTVSYHDPPRCYTSTSPRCSPLSRCFYSSHSSSKR